MVDRCRYTWCVAFAATLRQLSDVANQREELAENLNTQIVCELARYTQELKSERKSVSKKKITPVKKWKLNKILVKMLLRTVNKIKTISMIWS